MTHKDLYKQFCLQQAESKEEQARQLKAKDDSSEGKFGDGFKQQKLTGSGEKNTLRVAVWKDPAIQTQYDRAVVDFAAETFVSFRALGKLHIILRALYTNGNIKVSVRSHVTISRHVGLFAREMKMDIISIVNFVKTELTWLAFTTDCWTNRRNIPFMCLTFHFVSEDFKMERFVPFVTVFDERHTAHHLWLKMKSFYEALGISQPDTYKWVTCDNAANNKKMMIELSSDDTLDIWCMNHNYALVVKDGFKADLGHSNGSVSKLADKVKALVKFITKSRNNERELVQACIAVGIEYWKVKLANKTRWNSTVESFKSVKKIKPALDHLRARDSTGEWESKVLTTVEYRRMDDVIKVLEPFRDSTKVFESEKEPTVQRVVPELYNMTDKLKKFAKSPDTHVAAFAKALLKSLNERMPDNGTSNQVYRVAHFLDPFYQGELLREFGVYNIAREEVIELANEMLGQRTPAPAEPRVEDNNDEEEGDEEELSAADKAILAKRRRLNSGDSDTSSAVSASALSPIELELQIFEGMLTDASAKSLLLWWSNNKDKLPILARFVRNVMCVQASSSSSERIFSYGTDLCEPKRNRLSPQKIEELLIIKSNKANMAHFKERFQFPRVEKIINPAPVFEIGERLAVDDDSDEEEEESEEEEEEEEEVIE